MTGSVHIFPFRGTPSTKATFNTALTDDDFAYLGTANTFTATQTITGSSTFFTPLRMTATDASANPAPLLILLRDSASPAANDSLGIVQFQGQSSTDVTLTYAQISTVIADPTEGAEDGRLRFLTVIAGSSAVEATFEGGMILGSPTGSHKGLGTLNAVGVYDDNVLLTDLAFEAAETGTVDTDKWDATVPDLEIPEECHCEPVIEEAPFVRLEPNGDGSYKAVKSTAKRTKMRLASVVDDDGNEIGKVEEPVTREVVVPAKTIKRKHTIAHLVKDMLKDGFDPKDPRKYIDKMRAEKSLPCMPCEKDWEHGKYSLGEMASRKWVAMEFLAIAFGSLLDSHGNLSDRVAKLESGLPGIIDNSQA